MNPVESSGFAVRAGAPGKIILAGEHAVVYGAPVVALAVAVRAHCEVRALAEPVVRLVLRDPDQMALCAVSGLEPLRNALDRRWASCMTGRMAISCLLAHPGDLYFYALALLREHAPDAVMQDGGAEIVLDSQIPVGSGMGSSAATLAAVLAAVAETFRVNLTRSDLCTMISRAERLQHGCNSSIDPQVTVHGGMVRVGKGYRELREPPSISHWYLVHSGVPDVSTGECVSDVRHRLGSSDIWSEFHQVVTELERAFLGRNTKDLKHYMHQNHQLLVDIGVVPTGVQSFIRELGTRYDAAGKISGAGAVRGEKAGCVLVYSELSISDLCRDYGFSVTRLRCDCQGVRFYPDHARSSVLAASCG